ncbi:protein gamma response 1 [Nilaparvata lugens]|uniref:protein gamma response 1 n=1 Tax=Nilaparvata lugens TaxID=108931 RepID=UPI00193D9214|nr:protein gamma response 1 [Nilaparvata lugens]
MSTAEKNSTPHLAQKGDYLNDVWNSLYNPEINKHIEEDNLTIKAIFMLLETALKSVKSVAKELKQAEYEKESLRKSLQTIKSDNDILKQTVDQPCRQCPELQKKLTEQIKKTKDCKRSIQSIYTLLKPNIADNNGEDTQKALVETQTVMGKYFEEDSDIIPETPGCSTKTSIRQASKNDQQKIQSELNKSPVKQQSTTSNENVTPKKESIRKKSPEMSPIIKSGKRTIKSRGSQEDNSPDQNQKRTEPQNRSQGQSGTNAKLEWKLRANDSGSGHHSNKQSSLKQATLSVKARPRVETKRDLSLMNGFSGGTLPRPAATDHCDSDDCIASSPGIEPHRLSGLSLSKKRPRSSKEDEDNKSTDDQIPIVMTLDETHFAPLAASTCNVEQEEKKPKRNPSSNPNSKNQFKSEPSNPLPTSNSRKEQPTTKTEFKYERGAVKKKSERLKLDGWSCDDCEKYYATMEQAGMNTSQIKRTMNKCSRHRNQFQRPSTPPDFWNPKFDTSDEDD